MLNQSQPPSFQRLLEALSLHLGKGLLLTGMPHGQSIPSLRVVQAPPYSRSGKTTARALSWGRFLAVASAQLARLPASTFVIATTNPPSLPHLAWAWARARGGRFGVIVWDLYPDHLVRMGWLGSSHPITKAWTQANRRAFRDAAFVTTIGERIADGISRQMGRDGRRVEVIPLWADSDMIRPLDKAANPFAQEHHLADETVVLYAGNLGATHDLDGLLVAADRLRDERVRFLIIGDGLGRDRVAQAVTARQLRNVMLLPYQPWETVPYSLAVGDIAVVAQGHDAADLSVPSKTYSALAAGSAILALTSRESDLAKLVCQHNVGRVADPQDPEGIERTLRSMLDAPALLAELRARARRVAENELSFQSAFRRFHGLLAPHVNPAAR